MCHESLKWLKDSFGTLTGQRGAGQAAGHHAGEDCVLRAFQISSGMFLFEGVSWRFEFTAAFSLRTL